MVRKMMFISCNLNPATRRNNTTFRFAMNKRNPPLWVVAQLLAALRRRTTCASRESAVQALGRLRGPRRRGGTLCRHRFKVGRPCCDSAGSLSSRGVAAHCSGSRTGCRNPGERVRRSRVGTLFGGGEGDEPLAPSLVCRREPTGRSNRGILGEIVPRYVQCARFEEGSFCALFIRRGKIWLLEEEARCSWRLKPVRLDEVTHV